MIIPFEQLQPETLTQVIEAYIMQQGMDQFDTQYSLDSKVAQVRLQLEKKRLVLVFDAITESCNIITKEQLRQYNDPHREIDE
jgi:uncharacterized protein YheU (UPF0270 family)